MQAQQQSLIIPAVEDIKIYAPAISENKKIVDDLRGDLKDIFKSNPRISFSIDEEEQTVHFVGANRGLECTTLRQPYKTILKVARNYMEYTYLANGEVDMEIAHRIVKSRNR